jgi:CRP-like cAMP-binding protein
MSNKAHFRNGNRVLAALSARELEQVRPHLERVATEPRKPLWEPNQPITSVYFPLTSVNSVIALDYRGGEIEVGTIGNEGMVGLPVFLGAPTATGRAFTQIGGEAERMDVAIFTRMIESLPALRAVLHRYTQGFLTQVSQSVACNQLHSPEQRLARWLLSCADRVGSSRFDLTQDFMAQMLGVRRATVGEAAQGLQERGLIRYSRGTIEIRDRAALTNVACPCYGIVRDEFDKLLGVATG